MGLETALVLAGVVSPFVVEVVRWLEGKLINTVLSGSVGFVVAAVVSAVVTAGSLWYAQVPFVWSDFWIQGGSAFAISQAVYKLLLKPLDENTRLRVRA